MNALRFAALDAALVAMLARTEYGKTIAGLPDPAHELARLEAARLAQMIDDDFSDAERRRKGKR